MIFSGPKYFNEPTGVWISPHILQNKILFVAALDFGTTYSGIAWSFPWESENKITCFMWSPSEQGCQATIKTPTVLLLNPNKELLAFGYEAEEEYNKLVAKNSHREYYLFKNFKMFLYENEVIFCFICRLIFINLLDVQYSTNQNQSIKNKHNQTPGLLFCPLRLCSGSVMVDLALTRHMQTPGWPRPDTKPTQNAKKLPNVWRCSFGIYNRSAFSRLKCVKQTPTAEPEQTLIRPKQIYSPLIFWKTGPRLNPKRSHRRHFCRLFCVRSRLTGIVHALLIRNVLVINKFWSCFQNYLWNSSSGHMHIKYC